ncbi:MAG: hypothetical protein LQ349_001142 [Xanthoria aureola]|nr:MAG: hypothetical protein LQ349_001142 [Xanthoria aureola]
MATVAPSTTLRSNLYSTGVSYPLPASTKEHARLEEQSVCLADLMGCTIHVPLPSSPSLLLDIGCGTGVVTTHLGNTYPTARVYGIDLSLVPDIHNKPSNVEYIKGDIHELAVLDPRLAPGTAELVFGRLLVCGITDWPACIATMKTLLKPGAYVELQDLNNRLFDSDGNRIDEGFEWMRVLRESLAAKGLDPDPQHNARGYMEQAGLVDVQTWEYKWTVGPWLADKEPRTRLFGEFEGRYMVDPLAVLLDEMPDRTECSAEKREQLKAEMRKDMQYKKVGERGIYFTFTVTTGRKPLEE